MKNRAAFTLTDLIVTVLLLALLAGYCLSAVALADEQQERVLCAKHLRMIGQALLLYANENKGAYPRTLADSNVKVTPTWGTPYAGDEKLSASVGTESADPFAKDDSPVAQYKPKPNDITAALYLLIRTQDLPVTAFACPSTRNEPWDIGGSENTPLNWTNWRGTKVLRDHLSYSYQNPYPSQDAIGAGFKLNTSVADGFAVAADMNPGTDVLTKLTSRSHAAQLQRGNSANHRREGQNVLYGDGHVEFLQTPFCGLRQDNIFTYGKSGPDGGGTGIVGSPVDAADSILLPTARDIGAADDKGDLIDVVTPTTLTADQRASVQEKLVGTFLRKDVRGRSVQLEITQNKVTSIWGPQTIVYAYEVLATQGDRVRLELTSQELTPESAAVTIDPDGIRISGTQFFDGKWQRR